MSTFSAKHKKARLSVIISIIVLSVIFVASAIIFLVCSFKLLDGKREVRGAIICIDPGHGFADSGATNENIEPYTEAQINFAIARNIRESLVSRGYNAVLLHDFENIPDGYDADGDGVFDVEERVSYSDDIGAQVYISIHCDSFPTNDTVNGTRIYYQLTDNITCASLSASIVDAIDESDINRKESLLKPVFEDDAFYVIRNRENLASILIECGFITNRADAASLTSPDYQADFANAVVDGIDDFCN